LDKFGGTSTIDASIMAFGLHKFCGSTGYLVTKSLFITQPAFLDNQ